VRWLRLRAGCSKRGFDAKAFEATARTLTGEFGLDSGVRSRRASISYPEFAVEAT